MRVFHFAAVISLQLAGTFGGVLYSQEETNPDAYGRSDSGVVTSPYQSVMPWEDPADSVNREPLNLSEVIAAVNAYFPLLAAAFAERGIADGEYLSAMGAFDLSINASAINAPLGFYENYRYDVGFEQPVANGGMKFFGGYRVGRGIYPTWYGYRETNDGGEFRGGFRAPLLRDQPIDKRRAGLRKASVGRQAVEPKIQKQQIEFIRAASFAYWDWVAAGQSYVITKELLETAEERAQQLRLRVERGDLARIELTDNLRLIAGRQIKLVSAEQKLRQSAVKLSLFFRDIDGLPQIASANRLPADFPHTDPPDLNHIASDIELAMAMRPETRELELLRIKAAIDLRLAENDRNPRLDATVYNSKDIGLPTSKGDKTPLEMEAGLLFEVPLQRREANGRVRTASSKMSKLAAQLQFAQDKIMTDVQYAAAALDASYRQVDISKRAVELNAQLEVAERRQFQLGNSSLLIVNLREQATADARKVVVDALADFYRAHADYRAALGVDGGSVE